jgi:hypothetical protein
MQHLTSREKRRITSVLCQGKTSPALLTNPRDLKGHGFSRAVSRLFWTGALASEGPRDSGKFEIPQGLKPTSSSSIAARLKAVPLQGSFSTPDIDQEACECSI